MRYVTWQEFVALYPNVMTQTEFDLFEYDAEAWLDEWTLTVDGVQKLRVAFPTNEIDAEAVKRCIMALARTAKEMADYEAQSVASGSNGIVASVSSGSESMSFARGGSALARAVGDDAEKAKYIRGIVRRYLAGKRDANGVNLLYGGAYPLRIEDNNVQGYSNCL